MFKPLHLTLVSVRFLAELSRSRCLTLICLVLLGFLASASGQDRPVDSQPRNAAILVQKPSSDTPHAQTGAPAAAGQPQGLVHIVPFGKVGSAVQKGFAPGGAHLTYWGGPVISNIHMVAVFWGPNVNAVITGTPGIGQFFTDITTSRYYDLLSEYNTVGVTGSGTPATSSNQIIGHGTFDGKFTITPSVCPGPTACTVTDGQVAAELAGQINAGHLPQPVTDNQGNVNSFYMIYFPPGVTIALDAVTKSCAQFCAYHSNTPATLTPKLVPYGVEPDFAPPSGCANGCGGNPAMFDNVTEVTSHEMAEAVTDAQVGSATTTAPPLAWYDPNPATNPLGEIGDICVGQGAIVNAGNTTYVVQQEFSNVQNDCVDAPPVFNMTTPSGGVGPSLPFNMTLTIQSSANPFTLTGYTGTVHFTSSDAQATLPADYTFLPTDAGTHVFSFTLKALGDQTITVTDTHSAGFTGTATINVNTTPDLTISKSHTGNFSVGQTGATYTLTVSNVGHGPTSGTVTVVDTLPGGLTATAISGTGWTCTLGTLTCTRANALGLGSSYPAITLTVNVAANAPSQVTNTATVSGGGETNVANDNANDPTLVQAPDLAVLKSHFGPINGNFFQGETGATYTITVQNQGNLATSGTVTVVDTLPATGLNPTAISGTGWNCTLATLTCTRSDALAGGFSSYPPITLTVDVPLGAPDHVFNLANVSGGGEVNTGNDFAQDLTIILPPPAPDLAPFMNHSFNNFVQGQSGIYRIDISNVGTAITSGTVTVSDTLPTGLTATDMSGLGWTCSVGATSSCTRSDALQFNNSYAPIFLTVAIAANAPTNVVNSVTVSGGGETNTANNTFNDPTSIAVPLVDLSPAVAGTGFAAQAETGVNYTILIENNGNVSSNGSVTAVTTLSTGLTASAISGTGWTCTLTNLTCTRSDALIAFGVYPLTVTVDFAKNAPANGTVSETVSGGGDGNSANNTNSEFVNIQPMLGITPLGTSQTVFAGTAALYTMLVNPLTSAGAAAMSCSGLPAASTCSFSPATVPSGVGGVAVTMTISTTARTASVTDFRRGPWNNRPLLPLLLLMTAILATISLRHRLVTGRSIKPALALSGFLLLAALSGCGGGGGGGGPIVQNPQGTPAGTYSITVNAVSPNANASTPVTLIVR
ncbi:MAG: hypothetical protein ACXV8X_07785 [Candidatus Angelobacter sp.]